MAVNLCSEEILQKILAYLYVSVYNGLQYSRRYDGIGRRDGLKIRWWQHRVGSSPTTGTKPTKSESVSDWGRVRIFGIL